MDNSSRMGWLGGLQMKSRFGSNVEFFSAAPFFNLVGLALKTEYILLLPYDLLIMKADN
jgi:hypothetical protein